MSNLGMSATLEFDPTSQIAELRIRGLLKSAEYAPCASELASLIDSGKRPRLLVILENFGGWEKGGDWVGLDFIFTHGDKLVKIAIVGSGTKEAEVRDFVGADIRPTPVRFFDAAEAAEARDWLLE